MRYRRIQRKEEYLQHFFASLDSSVLANRRHLRRWLWRARREPHADSLAGLREAKEELVDEELIDYVKYQYSFYYKMYDDGA